MRTWLASDPARMTASFFVWMLGVVVAYRLSQAVGGAADVISFEGAIVGLLVLSLTWLISSLVLARSNALGRIAPALALTLGWWLLTWGQVSEDFAVDETPILVWLGFAMAIFGPAILVMRLLELLREANVGGLAD